MSKAEITYETEIVVETKYKRALSKIDLCGKVRVLSKKAFDLVARKKSELTNNIVRNGQYLSKDLSEINGLLGIKAIIGANSVVDIKANFAKNAELNVIFNFNRFSLRIFVVDIKNYLFLHVFKITGVEKVLLKRRLENVSKILKITVHLNTIIKINILADSFDLSSEIFESVSVGFKGSVEALEVIRINALSGKGRSCAENGESKKMKRVEMKKKCELCCVKDEECYKDCIDRAVEMVTESVK